MNALSIYTEEQINKNYTSSPEINLVMYFLYNCYANVQRSDVLRDWTRSIQLKAIFETHKNIGFEI